MALCCIDFVEIVGGKLYVFVVVVFTRATTVDVKNEVGVIIGIINDVMENTTNVVGVGEGFFEWTTFFSM